jgi:hypothetical protein
MSEKGVFRVETSNIIDPVPINLTITSGPQTLNATLVIEVFDCLKAIKIIEYK